MGPALQTRAHTLLTQTDLVTRVSLALNGVGGGVGTWASARFTLGFAAWLREIADPTVSTHTSRTPFSTRSRTPARARTPLGHSHSASRDTRARNVPTLHTLSRTRAHTRTHKRTATPNSIPTPIQSPAKALIDCDTPTLIHRHTHSPTHANHRHIHKQGLKYTCIPSPSLHFREP